jgi:hypothetical protein
MDKSPRRYRNARYEGYNLAKLQKRAANTGLDTTGLTIRRDYINALMADRIRTSATFVPDPRRTGFLDLSAELRNSIYAMVVVSEERIKITHNPDSERFEFWYHTKWDSLDLYDRHGLGQTVHLRIKDDGLAKLNILNYTIRREARSYFYGHNTFTLRLHYPEQQLSNQQYWHIEHQAVRLLGRAIGDDVALMPLWCVWRKEVPQMRYGDGLWLALGRSLS